MTHGNAAKSFMMRDGRVLMLLRRQNDVHKPGTWDIPGGRLQSGENPYHGVARETVEETHVPITVEQILDVQHFTRDDGQVITMMIFLCRAATDGVQLSEEHTAYEWVEPPEAVRRAPWLASVVSRYERWQRGA